MRRIALLALTAATLLPAGGCVSLCSDSRGKSFARNLVPFARRYRSCNGRHCRDRNGQHLDVRCRCSKACECWGGRGVAMAVEPSGGCCSSAGS
jgi:hypothetical protein